MAFKPGMSPNFVWFGSRFFCYLHRAVIIACLPYGDIRMFTVSLEISQFGLFKNFCVNQVSLLATPRPFATNGLLSADPHLKLYTPAINKAILRVFLLVSPQIFKNTVNCSIYK